MARPSHREKILAAGLRVVHARGFSGASVRDIVQAAGVPQGSFTNHFVSKEAFGLEVLDLYFDQARALLNATIGDEALRPLARLGAYIDGATCARGDDDGMRAGCLLGNFSAEVNELGEPLRLRLAAMFAETERALADCLRAAVAAGELPKTLDCKAAATLVLAALQGAILIAKAQRSPAPIERMRKTLFATVLAPAA
jgi:TetR/AcrR family transcriptional repressor of nem operon